LEFLKLQRDCSFDKTMVSKTTRFVASKHPIVFKNQSIFLILQKYFASKQDLRFNL
jgi:hypothetical protein